VNEPRGRNVRASPARLVQAKHLKTPGDGEKRIVGAKTTPASWWTRRIDLSRFADVVLASGPPTIRREAGVRE
jgi:hypothetical protein